MILLAAGQGTRLRPHTNEKPKALVPLFGRPLLEYQIEVLKLCGLTDINIVGGYCAEQLNSYGRLFKNIDFMTSNMVTSLFCARELFNGDSDIVVAYTDIVYSSNLLSNLLESKGDIVLASDREWFSYWSARMSEPLDDAETFRLCSDSENVVNLGEPIKTTDEVQGQYIGLIKINRSVTHKVLTHYDEMVKAFPGPQLDLHNLYMTQFLQSLINSGFQVKASQNERGWIEVDTVEDLRLYEQSGSLEKALYIGCSEL